ncbi:hypothetical protein EVAR_70555_1 [Eumeta japonica]|uniref:Uncharacterized protein n=1 Tax=Eumeta variegata TaxID=151549 RepID=A0A4C2A9U7_EUMVA|nr:hypothetical protein EVAR_70555_1 [Eumeta japonica]
MHAKCIKRITLVVAALHFLHINQIGSRVQKQCFIFHLQSRQNGRVSSRGRSILVHRRLDSLLELLSKFLCTALPIEVVVPRVLHEVRCGVDAANGSRHKYDDNVRVRCIEKNIGQLSYRKIQKKGKATCGVPEENLIFRKSAIKMMRTRNGRTDSSVGGETNGDTRIANATAFYALYCALQASVKTYEALRDFSLIDIEGRCVFDSEGFIESSRYVEPLTSCTGQHIKPPVPYRNCPRIVTTCVPRVVAGSQRDLRLYGDLREYGREVIASAGAIRPVSESSGGTTLSTLSVNPTSSVRYPIPSQEAGNALVTTLGLREFVADGDHVLSDGLPARLPLNCATKEI